MEPFIPMPSAQPAYLTPEVVPSRDEHEPAIGPNLAGVDQELDTRIIRFLVNDYFVPYEQMQMRFWNDWRQSDEAWRAKCQMIDLDIPIPTWNENTKNALLPNSRDGFTLKVSPTDMHKQWDALLKVGVQISFAEGLPVEAVKPEYTFETLYNPVDQTVQAANQILQDTAYNIDLKTTWRINFHSFLVKGHGWALTDLKRTFENVECRYTLGVDMALVQGAIQQLQQRYGDQQPRIEQGPQGFVAIYTERRVKEFFTNFSHLNPEDVFTDLLMDTRDMDTHPCPWVRQHIGEFALEENRYEQELNPFGWKNIERALEERNGQYVLCTEDEQVWRRKLEHRYNLTDQTLVKPQHTIKQLWTCYPKLRITDDGQLDEGQGIDCPQCQGSHTVKTEAGVMDCQTCQGSGKVRVPARRFICQFFGNPRIYGMTMLRRQLMPEGMKIPLLAAKDMIEDTSCAIPASKWTVAQNDFYIKAKAEALLLQGKEMAVNRGAIIFEESPAFDVEWWKPRAKIPVGSGGDKEFQRLDPNTFDEALTLAPYIAEKENRIQTILGATDTLLGEISSGRRSASEINLVADATKNPIVVMVDNYNRQMMGGWARMHLYNLNLFGDRDYIRMKTGREFIPDCHLRTAVAEEFVKKQLRIQNQRYLLEAGANNPVFMGIMPQLAQGLLDDMGLGHIRIDDGGLQKAQQDANRIVNRILGDGALTYPRPTDPHQIYCQIFADAIRDVQDNPENHWYGKCDATLPLLEQRLMMQEQALEMQKMQEMQQQMAMQAMQQPQEGKGTPGFKKTDQTPATPGGMNQGNQGPAGAAA